MPHASLEFSQGLEQRHDIQSVCRKLFDALAAEEAFDPETIKVRARPVAYSYIGTEPQSFVHATLLLMEGRDVATRAHLNEVIMNVLDEALPDVGSITVQDVEMTRATYAKRLRQTTD